MMALTAWAQHKQCLQQPIARISRRQAAQTKQASLHEQTGNEKYEVVGQIFSASLTGNGLFIQD